MYALCLQFSIVKLILFLKWKFGVREERGNGNREKKWDYCRILQRFFSVRMSTFSWQLFLEQFKDQSRISLQMEEQRAGFSQREPDMRSPGAPKMSFSCKPVSDFKAVTTVKAFFYVFSSHYQDAITHICQLNAIKKMTAHTAVLPFPFLIPAEKWSGLNSQGCNYFLNAV